ncbi:MAG TPA: hypothetical protein VFC82_02450 [Actinomycetaceae bacterium]|nr:hypothetical protein [Actinomycetaceae bacterium]
MSADLDAERQIPASPQTVRAMPWRRPISLIVAGVVLVALAVGPAIVTPLGPITTAQALVTMLLVLAAGSVVGVLTPSRWTLLAAPAFFAVFPEVAHIGTPGPLAGMPDFSSSLGTVAFLVGRLIPAALTLTPMVLGLALGIELAAHLGHPATRRLRWSGRVAGVVVAILIVWLVIAMAQPTTMAPSSAVISRHLTVR